MFISRKSHDLIVETLKASHESQIATLKASHDQVVAELRKQNDSLTEERNHYRKEWTKSRGKAFTKRADAEPPMPLFDPPPSPAQESPFDVDWTLDDRDLFTRWSTGVAREVDPKEEWQRQYGAQSPLVALTV